MLDALAGWLAAAVAVAGWRLQARLRSQRALFGATEGRTRTPEGSGSQEVSNS